MTTQLTSLIPTLDGTNYIKWAHNMKSYLQNQGYWRKMNKPCPKLTKSAEATSESASDEVIGNEEEIEAWEENNDKAVGSIHLRLFHTLQHKYQGLLVASTLWKQIEKDYGSPGVTAIYLEFKAALDTPIPPNSDPRPACDKILSHLQ